MNTVSYSFLLFLSPESHESMESHEYLSKRLLYFFFNSKCAADISKTISLCFTMGIK